MAIGGGGGYPGSAKACFKSFSFSTVCGGTCCTNIEVGVLGRLWGGSGDFLVVDCTFSQNFVGICGCNSVDFIGSTILGGGGLVEANFATGVGSGSSICVDFLLTACWGGNTVVCCRLIIDGNNLHLSLVGDGDFDSVDFEGFANDMSEGGVLGLKESRFSGFSITIASDGNCSPDFCNSLGGG